MLFIFKNILNIASLLQSKLILTNSHKKNKKFQYKEKYKTSNGRCTLQKIIHNSRKDIIAIYRIIHEDGIGSIMIKLYDLNKYKVKTQLDLLDKARQGNLEKTENYIKKYKNMNIDRYTHRLYISNEKNSQYKTYSIIDLKLNNSSNEYNNYYPEKIIFLFLKNTINKAYKFNYKDANLCLLQEFRHQDIIKLAQKFYESKNYSISDLTSKVIYCRSNKHE